jgi:Methyltransferase domain
MKDNFSTQADVYARYRPTYPPELFDFILKHTPGRMFAWDCATGNGQTARELAKHFDTVYATDISQKQLDNAVQADNIFYSNQPAEHTDFPPSCFDLITVSQALHWLRFDDFYAEVRRTGKRNAILATWMYTRLPITSEIEMIIHKLYSDILGKYWDSERKHVDANYSTIPFPFEEIKTPSFEIRFNWTLAELEGYFNSWSALQNYLKDGNESPIGQIIEEIAPLWKKDRMEVVFPIVMKLGRI